MKLLGVKLWRKRRILSEFVSALENRDARIRVCPCGKTECKQYFIVHADGRTVSLSKRAYAFLSEMYPGRVL